MLQEILRSELASEGLLVIDQSEDVLESLVGHAAYLLDRFWIHSHVAQSQVRYLNPHKKVESRLMAVSNFVRLHGAVVRTLVNSLPSRRPCWRILLWLASAQREEVFAPHQVTITPQAGELLYFGEPLPNQAAICTTMQLNVARNTRFCLHGLQLLGLALDDMPTIHGWALKHELAAVAGLQIIEEAGLKECRDASERKRANEQAQLALLRHLVAFPQKAAHRNA